MPELESPTKFKVLKIVDDSGGTESRDLARIMGISIPHASKLLRDYWTQGLLKREKGRWIKVESDTFSIWDHQEKIGSNTSRIIFKFNF